MRRILFFMFAAALAVPASASAQQTVNIFLGGFVPRAVDARDPNDVLVADLSNEQPLAFNVSDFNAFTIGGEWLFPFGSHLEGGVGLGFYNRTVPTVYQYLVNNDGSEIEQDLKLRVVPFTATVRFLPLGEENPFQPYIGAGVMAAYWRYAETGQFVDLTVKSGGAAGPVVLGGVRFVIDPILFGGEVRWQSAKGDLPTTGANSFLGSKLDLGGVNYLFTIGVRF
jgi:outer membrane protein W